MESLASPAESFDLYLQMRQQLDAAAIRFQKDALFVFADSLSQFAQAHLHVFRSVSNPQASDREYTRKAHLALIENLANLWQEFEESQIPIIQQYLHVGCRQLATEIESIIEAAPDHLTITLSEDQIDRLEETGGQKTWKLWTHQLTGKPIVQTVKFKKLLQHDWHAIYLRNLHSVLNTLNLSARDHFAALGELIRTHQAKRFPGQVRLLEEDTFTPEETVEELSVALQRQGDRLVTFMQELHALMEIRLRNETRQLDINQQLKRKGWDTQRQLSVLHTFSANWAENMALLFEQQQAEFQLQHIQAQLIWVSKGIVSELNFRCFTATESSLVQLQEEVRLLQELIADKKWEELQQLGLDPSALLLVPDDRIISGAVAHLIQHISTLPESIELAMPSSWARLSLGGSDKLESRAFELAEMTNYLTKTYYLAPLEEALLQLPEAFKELYHRVQSGIRLITFHLPNGESKVENGNLATVIQRSEAQFQLAQEELHANRQRMTSLLQRVEAEFLQLLAIDQLRAEAASWKLSSGNRSSTPKRKIRDLRLRGVQWLRTKFEWLSSRVNQAQDQLLLADLQQDLEQDSPGIASIRTWSRLISPAPAILQQLPYYYKQLFVGNQRIARKLMVGREQELAQASRLVSMMKAGLGGAMMIVGEPQSGKTYFSEYVADILFGSKVVQIIPANAGSRSTNDLVAAFRNRLGGAGTLVQMIQAELPGTVFLVDDLELWWERSPNGEQVIRR
ncbi:MAG: hypothetical protein AAF399_13240, partial [Bacteroidota bacterium]